MKISEEVAPAVVFWMYVRACFLFTRNKKAARK